MYGMDIKYIIPLLTPSAVDCPSSLSKTARHMAHWAFVSSMEKNINTQRITLGFILCIIRGNHNIYNYPGYGYIQPHWKSEFGYFFMPFNIIGYGPNISNQHKRYNDD